MRADDERHGSNAGYVAGCRLDCCKVAHATYRRRLRARRYLAGVDRFKVDATGTVRRIRALQALGWRFVDIEAAMGRTVKNTPNCTAVHNLIGQRAVHISTAREVDAAYQALSMTLGPSKRLRAIGRKRGWVTPLAWDDIDDPAEVPRDWRYTEPTRLELVADMLEQGANVTEVCRRLGITRDALWTWCSNNGLRPTYAALVRRETSAA